jgi:hypothetical protein
MEELDLVIKSLRTRMDETRIQEKEEDYASLRKIYDMANIEHSSRVATTIFTVG